ncbi:proline-rich protein PRCC [Pectinophora gossypiella]|uniref:proline-rich protein PRCC n=1 Tax=Pectinophora gossypiella TaxID=13191 RepID=UPI00214E6873|nr:proline-rich protein PRCC [Pectinophora gossypiella]
MALVAYDNSDSSEFEDDDNESTVIIPTPNHKVGDTIASEPATNDSEVLNQSLFNLLPQPSAKKTQVIEEDDEFLHKKETAANIVKPKAKITVPSLSDFKDVEDRPLPKPKPTNGKKSGLLSMLPQPRNAAITKSTSLIPNVLTKKPLVPTSVKKKTPILSPVKKARTETKGLVDHYSDDSDNDEEETTDFFSIHKPIEVPLVDTPLDIDLPVQIPKTDTVEKKPRNIQSYFKQDVPQHVELEPDYTALTNGPESYSNAASSSHNNGYAEPIGSSSDVVLDEEAIRQLCGARGKRKREDIQIVDVNQQEVLADAREWLMKGLMDDTSKRVSSSKKRGDEPTTQQRRKHQITYLAHQAKANEVELQNQWANNRMSKRQTQSKYGF